MHYGAKIQITFSAVTAGGDLCLLPRIAQKSSHHLCNQPQGLCGLCFLLRDFFTCWFSYDFFHLDALLQGRTRSVQGQL